jgi:CubicO group peptidase (beta-lactamase class C family)
MKRLLILSSALVVAMASCDPAPKKAANTTPDGRLVRAEAPVADFDATALTACEAAFAADSLDIHSMMVLHHGRVVAEKWWGEGSPDTPHTMFSVSKSFTATAVGFGIAEGLLSLDDRVVSFFPDKVPADHSPNLDAMTVRNLLTMSTGQVREPSRRGQEDWIAAFMSTPVDDTPGALFRYNSMATFMLSAIMQKVSGQKIADYLQTRLFGPLAIEGYSWEESPEGINTGGWGLSIKTEDMAKFGQLFLQDGVWNGERVLPEGWVAEASSWKIASGPAGNETLEDPLNNWTQGYCYQMWRCPHNAYRADGARGQYIVVIPDRDAVVVLTANAHDMGAELDLVWEHILPALK